MSISVLIIDDDQSMSQIIYSVLNKSGYRAHRVGEANSAIEFLKDNHVDLILLDIEMPGISGMKLLDILKEQRETAGIPIIMLSVLKEETYKIRGLKGGADDYLPKPFSINELLARIEALLRRTKNAGKLENILSVGDISIDLDRQEVTAKKKKIALTRTEYSLLELFMRRKGYVVSYKNLIDYLSENERDASSETLYAHVKNLRRKLGPLGDSIENVHGVGYKLKDY
ncbi:MAG: response regulator transcription factor [Elusimicrobia bacterium]|nr:response regulator transcription factor [Elusimicrobiota bacterium]